MAGKDSGYAHSHADKQDRYKKLMTDTKSLGNSFDSAEGTVPVAGSEWEETTPSKGKGPKVGNVVPGDEAKGEGPNGR